MIKRFIKQSIAVTTSIALLAAIAVPSILYLKPQATTSQAINNAAETTINDGIIETVIDSKKINKMEGEKWTDSFESNKGYKFLAPAWGAHVYSINENGFIVDESYPELTGAGRLLDVYPTWARSNGANAVSLYAYKSDVLNLGSTTNFQTAFGNNYTEGLPGKTNLNGVPSVKLSNQNPFLTAKLVFPNFYYDNLDAGPRPPTGLPPYPTFSPTFRLHQNVGSFFRSNLNSQSYGGGSGGEISDPTWETVWQYIPREFSSSWGFVATKSTITEYNMALFNDYHTDGTLIGTHLWDLHTSSAKLSTKLPTITIDETKLNKDYNILQQDYDLDGIVKFSGYENLPSVFSKLTATGNVRTGSVTFSYNPGYIIQNSQIVKYTGSTITKTISGFSLLASGIKALANYPKEVVVDKWIASISKADKSIDPKKLALYLDLSTIPSTASYTITIDSDLAKAYDYKKGIIDFKISASQGKDFDGNLVNKKTVDFPIKLELTPRITTYKVDSKNPGNLTADAFRSRIFSATDELNLSEFYNYGGAIVAPVENAKYFLVPDSYEFNTGDGTAQFQVYASQYYNSEAVLTNGSSTDLNSHSQPFTFNLHRSPTTIETVNDFIPEHRVDRLIDAVTNEDGEVIDAATLNKYIKIENLPSDSVLSISKKDGDIVYSNYTDTDYRDTVTFKLKATKFNKANSVIDINVIREFTLKLLPQYKTTDAIVKTLPNNPDRIDVFKNKIETLSGADLITYLKGYIDFTSLRNDATITANVSNYDPYNGDLQLELDIEKFYDDQNDENLGAKKINGLNISLLPVPTTVSVIKPNDTSVRLDRFVKTFADEATGVVNNLAVLQKYVSFDVWNPDTTLTIDTDSIKMNNATGEWNGDLIMAEANDLDSTRVPNKRFPLQFQFAEKYDSTTIKQLPEYPLVQLDDFRNNLFDEAGFAKPEIYNYFDVYSLPPNGKLKLVEAPVIDYPNAQLTIKVEITSYYDQDSDLQESAPITRNTPWIETFTFDLLSPQTNIAVTENYDQTPRVDRFAASIKTLTDDDLKAALADYVSFDHLPANTTLSIDQTSMAITNIPGTLKFDVLASRYFDAAGYLQTSTKPFPIILNLANKYTTTNITAKTSAELPAGKLRVDRFIDALGATEADPEITNGEVLNQYVNIISAPLDTKLFIDYASPITIEQRTGKINFSIKVNQYYDVNSDLQTKNLSFPVELTLAVVHEPTAITAKTTNLPNTRADRLLRTFMDTSTNKITNIDVLKQYVDITSLPSIATLFVTRSVVNTKLGTISFNLIASHYYDLNSDIQTDSVQTATHPFPISLQLAPKIDATNFTAKTTLPDDVLVNELTEYIAPNGVTNRERFEQYIDAISLPTNTKIELEETSHSITTGKILYNVKVNQYYDTEGDLQTKSKSYSVALQLSPVYAETEIYALDNYPTDLDITTFKQYVLDSSDSVVLDNLQKFVGIVSLPTASQLTIAWGTETDTTIDFIVHASQYYNAQHKLAYDKDFNISLTFNNNVLPTDIKAWPTYPQMAAHQFFKLVNPNNKIDYTQLSKYLDLSTVPFDATLTITNTNPDDNQKPGLVTFDITTSTWYDENKVHHISNKSFSISLNLTPKYAETILFGFASVEKDITLDDFWLQISTNNKLDQAKLAQYVNLDSLVPNTKLQYLNPVKGWNGGITFDLVVDRYYDADGTENAGKKVFKIVLNNLAVNLDQKQIDDYTWLYVTVALVFSALGSLVLFLIAKNRNKNK